MKWILGIVCILAIVGCPAPIINVLPPTPPPTTPVVPPPAGLTGPVLAALYDGSTVRLWDGTHAVTWKTGAAVHGNGRKIAVDKTLYFLDAAGGVTSSMNLPADPSGVAVVGDPVVYTFQTISNADAFALDYSPPQSGGGYTRIWQDGVESGDWHTRKWFYDHSYTVENGDIIAVDNQGNFHDISRALTDAQIEWAIPDGPLFYVPDMGTPNTLTVYDETGSHSVTATGGNVNDWGGQPWIQAADGNWYDGIGQMWNPTAHTFTTYANALKQFASTFPPLVTATGFIYHDGGQSPVMLSAYSDSDSIYFIECVSGFLIKYTPITDTLAPLETNDGVNFHTATPLYQGDGYRTTGMAQAVTLEPSLIEGALYYHQAGTLWQMDTASTIVSSFSADQQMWVMK